MKKKLLLISVLCIVCAGVSGQPKTNAIKKEGDGDLLAQPYQWDVKTPTPTIVGVSWVCNCYSSIFADKWFLVFTTIKLILDIRTQIANMEVTPYTPPNWYADWNEYLDDARSKVFEYCARFNTTGDCGCLVDLKNQLYHDKFIITNMALSWIIPSEPLECD